MCGLIGMIPARKERCRKELNEVGEMFTRLLVFSEHRGPHATGVAGVKSDGGISVLKRPLRARDFVRLPAYREWMDSIGPDTTCLMGHTRWPTRGSIMNPANNHPLISEGPGAIVAATHNGNLAEVEKHFRRLGLRRTAQVDSELLLRIAERHSSEAGLDLGAFLDDLEQVHGLMSAAIVASSRPGDIILLKGNRPLEVRYHAGLGTMAYASEAEILDAALTRDGWREVTLDTCEGLIVHADEDLRLERFEFRFGEPSRGQWREWR